LNLEYIVSDIDSNHSTIGCSIIMISAVQRANVSNVRRLGFVTTVWLCWVFISAAAHPFDRTLLATTPSRHGMPPLRGGGAVVERSPFKRGRGIRPPSSSSEAGDQNIPPGTADHTAQVLNLVKTIIGAGVLGLPAGMAASFGTSQTLPRSIFLLVLIGWLAAHGFHHVGSVCRVTGSTSYSQAWERTVAAPGTTWIPNTACVMVTVGTVLTYSMVLADTIPSLLAPMLQSIGLANLPVTRNGVLWILTVTTILPLCLLQSLKALAPFSLLGICGMVYTGVIMALRSMDGSYALPNGRFVSTLASQWYVISCSKVVEQRGSDALFWQCMQSSHISI
jgi:Transmembrane amino acid transporter protein